MVRTSSSNARVAGSIPGQKAKIPHAHQKPGHKQWKQHINTFNKDFENGPHQKNL